MEFDREFTSDPPVGGDAGQGASGEVVVECRSKRWTGRELNQYANRVAHRLQREGLKPGDLVGLCVERSVEMLGAMLGVLKAGGAYVPLDPRHPRERLEMVLEDAGASYWWWGVRSHRRSPHFEDDCKDVALDAKIAEESDCAAAGSDLRGFACVRDLHLRNDWKAEGRSHRTQRIDESVALDGA